MWIKLFTEWDIKGCFHSKIHTKVKVHHKSSCILLDTNRLWLSPHLEVSGCCCKFPSVGHTTPWWSATSLYMWRWLLWNKWDLIWKCPSTAQLREKLPWLLLMHCVTAVCGKGATVLTPQVLISKHKRMEKFKHQNCIHMTHLWTKRDFDLFLNGVGCGVLDSLSVSDFSYSVL